jgi:hypothetical protein
MCMNHDSLKLEPKERRIARSVNVSNDDLKDH